MYPLLILSLVSVEDDGNGDRVILCATFKALANPFTTTGICIPNAVVAKEGNDNVRFRLPSSKIILASGTIAVPAPTSSRTAVTPCTGGNQRFNYPELDDGCLPP